MPGSEGAFASGDDLPVERLRLVITGLGAIHGGEIKGYNCQVVGFGVERLGEVFFRFGIAALHVRLVAGCSRRRSGNTQQYFEQETG